MLLGDEVGANIDMTGGGHIIGEKFLCDKYFIKQRKATIKVKHFTVIGLKNLLVDTICCIVIIEGKEQWFDTRDGIALFRDKVGDEIDGE